PMSRSYSSSPKSAVRFAGRTIPAQLTAMSSPPKASTVACTAASTDAATATSSGTARAVPPTLVTRSTVSRANSGLMSPTATTARVLEVLEPLRARLDIADLGAARRDDLFGRHRVHGLGVLLPIVHEPRVARGRLVQPWREELLDLLVVGAHVRTAEVQRFLL